jgi:hypothetical protein
MIFIHIPTAINVLLARRSIERQDQGQFLNTLQEKAERSMVQYTEISLEASMRSHSICS